MKTYQRFEIVELAVAKLGKWCVYLNNGSDMDDLYVFNFVVRRLETLGIEGIDISTILSSELMVFDCEEKAREMFNVFNMPPVYASPFYAVLYNPEGVEIDINT